MNTVLEEKSTLADHFEDFIGQKVAVLCMRYQYRGVLSKVGDGFIVLANPTAVQSSGAAHSPAPQSEDPIGCSLTIKTDVIEIFYQPAFAMAALPDEE